MYNFKFADIGEGIHEGKILEWKYKKGDTVKEGDTLVIIETDKVNAEIPIPVDGKILELGPDEGEQIEVGDLLAKIDNGESNGEETKDNKKTETKEKTKSSDESKKASKAETQEKEQDEDEGGVVGKLESSDEVIASSTETKQKNKTTERILATPVARKLASDLNIDIKDIKGTGEHGRVLKEDIENHKDQAKARTKQKDINIPEIKTYEEDKREKITSLRRSVVNQMTLSKQIIPHTTLIDELNVTELVKFRNQHKEKAKENDVKLTYMAFIVKALVKTIQDYPILNSSYDQENEEIIYRGNINIGIAVDTPDGLIVPNIKNTDKLSLFEIANKIEELAKLAKERKIQLKDLQKGTISITNFGAFDAISGTPIIKHSEVAILGIGKITKKPIVINDKIEIGDILPLSLTFDHRIIDGADGGRAMRAFKKYLKDPLLLLMN